MVKGATTEEVASSRRKVGEWAVWKHMARDKVGETDTRLRWRVARKDDFLQPSEESCPPTPSAAASMAQGHGQE